MIELKYTFRDPAKEKQFQYLHPHLRRLFLLVCHVLNEMEFDVLITSMIRPPNTIPGESGVHSVGRAIDFIPMSREKITSQNLDLKMNLLCECIEKLYKRDDGKSLLMWHEVPGGGGKHLHGQVPATPDFQDLSGTIPDHDA